MARVSTRRHTPPSIDTARLQIAADQPLSAVDAETDPFQPSASARLPLATVVRSQAETFSRCLVADC